MNEDHVQQMKTAYNRLAATYHRNRGQFDLSDLYERFRRQLPPTGHVVDLGCGAGDSFAAYFARDGWEVTGYDFSEAMLELARRNNPAMHTHCCDLRHVVLPEAGYEVAISIYALFHLSVAEQYVLLAKIHRALRPGGWCYFTYETASPAEAAGVEHRSELMGETFFYAHDPAESFQARLREIGFVIASVECHTIAGETFFWYTLRK